MKNLPLDFYMGSSESVVLQSPRRCWRVKRMTNPVRDDLLVIRVDPPVPGGPFGLPDMDFVIVASRLESGSLFPINTFPAEPLPVHVARPPVDWRNRTNLTKGELESLYWAELYPSEAEARATMTYAQARKYGKRI